MPPRYGRSRSGALVGLGLAIAGLWWAGSSEDRKAIAISDGDSLRDAPAEPAKPAGRGNGASVVSAGDPPKNADTPAPNVISSIVKTTQKEALGQAQKPKTGASPTKSILLPKPEIVKIEFKKRLNAAKPIGVRGANWRHSEFKGKLGKTFARAQQARADQLSGQTGKTYDNEAPLIVLDEKPKKIIQNASPNRAIRNLPSPDLGSQPSMNKGPSGIVVPISGVQCTVPFVKVGADCGCPPGTIRTSAGCDELPPEN